MSGSNFSAPGLPPAEALERAVATGGGSSAPARVRAGRWKMLAVLAVCAAPVLVSYFLYYVVRPEGRTNYATLVQPTRPLPADLPLATLDGEPVAAASLKGQWLLVTVGSGSCPSDCEQRLFLQRQLREMMGKERERVDKLWLVTDDAPVAPALREALSSPPATVLRTSRAALERWLQPEPGQPLEASLYLVDPMGEWMMRSPPQPDPAKLKRDLDKLLRASAGWDRPGR